MENLRNKKTDVSNLFKCMDHETCDCMSDMFLWTDPNHLELIDMLTGKYDPFEEIRDAKKKEDSRSRKKIHAQSITDLFNIILDDGFDIVIGTENGDGIIKLIERDNNEPTKPT